jgi:hypothetical protein
MLIYRMIREILKGIPLAFRAPTPDRELKAEIYRFSWKYCTIF